MRRVPVREEWLDDYFKTLVISFENDEYAEAGGSKTSGKHEIVLIMATYLFGLFLQFWDVFLHFHLLHAH